MVLGAQYLKCNHCGNTVEAARKGENCPLCEKGKLVTPVIHRKRAMKYQREKV